MKESNPESSLTALHKGKDYAKLLATTALAYSPHLYFMAMTQGVGGVTRHAAMVAGMILAAQIPYVREVPLLASRIFMRTLLVRGVKDASPRVSALFNEVAQAADIKGLKIYEYERGVNKNAVAFADSVYIGKSLIDTMDDRELKAVIAHEVAHHKTRDMVPTLMAWVPYWASIVSLVGASVKALDAQNLPLALGIVGASYGYYKYQTAVRGYGSRVMEYRADRNAVNFTRDPAAMVSAQCKLADTDVESVELINKGQDYLRRSPSYKFRQLFNTHIFQTHPHVWDRVKAIEEHGQKLKDAGLLPPPCADQDFKAKPPQPKMV